MDKVKEAIRRGERTKRWFEDQEVQKVFKELGEDIVVLWTKTASDQDDERERLYREMHGLTALRRRILKIIEDGRKAEHEVNERGKRAGR